MCCLYSTVSLSHIITSGDTRFSKLSDKCNGVKVQYSPLRCIESTRVNVRVHQYVQLGCVAEQDAVSSVVLRPAGGAVGRAGPVLLSETQPENKRASDRLTVFDLFHPHEL